MEDIAEAHERTFQWIFTDPVPYQKPWSNFIEWLEKGKGCYWINGKAGSGKSTLMKYVQGEQRTRDALSAWPGPSKLIISPFFFCNLGSPLQKSQSGLLRGLLHNILEQYPDLIPVAFPDLYRQILGLEKAYEIEERLALDAPTFAELRKACLALISQNSYPLRICIFIDGIDEYDGDHSQICDFFTHFVTSSSCVKIVLSSRPIPACLAAFSSYPGLRLQDLTYPDIERYVDDRLAKHVSMARLVAREGESAAQLTTDISNRAPGVFLWVMLAVKSLLDGLHSYDRVADLHRRLELLPPDLENLYQHMMDRMTPLYRQQASQFFQIIVASTKLQHREPLNLLQLSYTEENPQIIIDRRTEPFSEKEASLRCEDTEGRLRSRCCGLLEVMDRRTVAMPRRLYVGFLHRTVLEFLRKEKVWKDILHLTSTTTFDARVALLQACLMEVKINIAFECQTVIIATAFAWIKMRQCLQYSTLAEGTTKRPQTIFLDELNSVMSIHWSHVAQWKRNAREGPFSKLGGHWALAANDYRQRDPRCAFAYSSFVSLAACYGSIL